MIGVQAERRSDDSRKLLKTPGIDCPKDPLGEIDAFIKERNPLGFVRIEPSPPVTMRFVRRAGDLSDGVAHPIFKKPLKPLIS